jgi:hypothetical protein
VDSNSFCLYLERKRGGSDMGLILSRQIAVVHGVVLQLANHNDRQGCEAVLALPITYGGAGG